MLEKRSIHRVVLYPVEGTLPKGEDPDGNAQKKNRSAFVVWTLALLLLIIAIMLLRKFG
jgi:hypothetical protein